MQKNHTIPASENLHHGKGLFPVWKPMGVSAFWFNDELFAVGWNTPMLLTLNRTGWVLKNLMKVQPPTWPELHMPYRKRRDCDKGVQPLLGLQVSLRSSTTACEREGTPFLPPPRIVQFGQWVAERAPILPAVYEHCATTNPVASLPANQNVKQTVTRNKGVYCLHWAFLNYSAALFADQKLIHAVDEHHYYYFRRTTAS